MPTTNSFFGTCGPGIIASGSAGQHRTGCRTHPVGHRQADDEFRACRRLRLAEFQRAIVGFDQAARNAKSDARAMIERLGGEKRIENAVADRGRNTRTIVANADASIVAQYGTSGPGTHTEVGNRGTISATPMGLAFDGPAEIRNSGTIHGKVFASIHSCCRMAGRPSSNMAAWAPTARGAAPAPTPGFCWVAMIGLS